MSGDIDHSVNKKLESLLKKHPDTKLVIMKEVPGSMDDVANLEAARLLRSKKIATHLPSDGVVASGGTDFFLAGVKRTLEKGAKIGVHSWADGGFFSSKTALDYPKDDEAHQLYLEYYKDMGIPTDFYWYTLQAAPAESIHWMTPTEITKYKILTDQ